MLAHALKHILNQLDLVDEILVVLNGLMAGKALTLELDLVRQKRLGNIKLELLQQFILLLSVRL